MQSWRDHRKQVAEPERFKDDFPEIWEKVLKGENDFEIIFGKTTFVIHITRERRFGQKIPKGEISTIERMKIDDWKEYLSQTGTFMEGGRRKNRHIKRSKVVKGTQTSLGTQ